MKALFLWSLKMCIARKKPLNFLASTFLSAAMAIFSHATANAQSPDSLEITGAMLSYGSRLNSSPELGSGQYIPANSEEACKNAAAAKYIISNSGGFNRAAWALCLTKDNRAVVMYQCTSANPATCTIYRDYRVDPVVPR